MKIGEKIKQLRSEKDFTLKELSVKSGLSVSFISDIENGRRNPSIENLRKIAKALNVSASNLLKEQDPFKNQNVFDKETDEIMKDPQVRAIARATRNLSPEKKELLQKLAESMIEEAKKDANKDK